MTEDPYVLVKFVGLAHTPYNIVTSEQWSNYWERMAERNGSVSWQEVARGTHKEMEALARLMPDPKRLNFD